MRTVVGGRYGRHTTADPYHKSAIISGESSKPRQEICAPLKWLCFALNFFVVLIGVTCLTLGVYLCIKDPRGIHEWADIVLNPAIMLIIVGLAVCIVSLLGSMGALRDNVLLLKTFALSVFFCYILIVIGTFLVFILFYSDTTEGLSAHSILLYSIKNYHTNRNLADFVDYIQEQMECCGASSASQGYRDWQLSDQFNCSSYNPYPEKCGVPFSCCRRSVISEAAGSSNPLLPAMRSLECWQNAQTKRPQELETAIHVRGCLQPLRALFDKYALHIGAAVAAVIIPVCVSVCLSNILARQIDHQRYLLEREARRMERVKRRERAQYKYMITPYENVECGALAVPSAPSLPVSPPAPPASAPPPPPPPVQPSAPPPQKSSIIQPPPQSSVPHASTSVRAQNVELKERNVQRVNDGKQMKQSSRCNVPQQSVVPPHTVHRNADDDPSRSRRPRQRASSSENKRFRSSSLQNACDVAQNRGSPVDHAVQGGRQKKSLAGDRRRQRLPTPQTIAESRTQQWVLDQQRDAASRQQVS
ncbi:hypothetical protein AB6A40_002512 [Gnathostoma spinigerum]|uniref:Tetraspanin n=1 Tax=Gnathostoma spinigerum TaxID=75299 RepID=A0ABD6E6S3_9BILA